MNPETNQFEQLSEIFRAEGNSSVGPNASDQMSALQRQLAGGPLIRPDGTPVPKHWSVFTVGDNVVVNNYTFKVAYMNETTLVLEPVGVAVLSTKDASK